MHLLNHLPLLSIVVIIIAGMFIFNFDGYVYGLIKPENNKYSEYSKINDNLITELKFEKENQEKPLSENLDPEIIQDKTQKEKDETIKDEYTDNIILEKEKFYLHGNGEAWISSKRSIAPVEINVELLPVKGTKLTKFDLVDAKIIVEDKSYNFHQGTVTIQNSGLTLNIFSGIENSIFFSINGLLDNDIKDSVYNGKVIFNDGQFYIYEQGVGQIKFSDLKATISSVV